LGAVEILNEGLEIKIALILLEVVSVFKTDGQSLGLQNLLGEGRLITPPFGVGEIFVQHAGRPTGGGVIVNIGAVVIELIVVDPIGKAPAAAKLAIVLQIEEAAHVDRVGSGDVKDGSEGSGGDVLVARGKNRVQCEASPGDIGKELVKLITVCVEGNAVVGGGMVEFLKEKPVVSMGIIEGAGSSSCTPLLNLSP
jgi:hypothetical protein